MLASTFDYVLFASILVVLATMIATLMLPNWFVETPAGQLPGQDMKLNLHGGFLMKCARIDWNGELPLTWKGIPLGDIDVLPGGMPPFSVCASISDLTAVQNQLAADARAYTLSPNASWLLRLLHLSGVWRKLSADTSSHWLAPTQASGALALICVFAALVLMVPSTLTNIWSVGALCFAILFASLTVAFGVELYAAKPSSQWKSRPAWAFYVFVSCLLLLVLCAATLSWNHFRHRGAPDDTATLVQSAAART